MDSSSRMTVSSSIFVVVGDDVLGERDVGLVERLRRVLDREDDELRDLDQAVLNLGQLLLEYFAHGGEILPGVRTHAGCGADRPLQHVPFVRLTVGAADLNSV